MSTLTAVGYHDLASRMEGDDKKIGAVIEVIGQTNQILDEALTVECNDGTGHKSTQRSGYPTATWRHFNAGVVPTKSTTSQIRDTTGMLEAYAEVDKDLADLNGNAPAWRLSEDKAHTEGMNNQMATTTFYGSVLTYPDRFTGLAPRYAALGTDPLVSTYNAVNAYSSAAAADQTSMWLVVWGDTTCHFLFPKGSKGGFQYQDLGEQTLFDDQTPVAGRYQGYRSHYKWDLGLTVRDWRYVVRICNIDTSAITTTVVDLLSAMIEAYERVPDFGGRAAFYANRTVRTWLWKQAQAKTNVNLTIDNPAGKPVVSFLGIPIRRSDALTNAESVVS